MEKILFVEGVRLPSSTSSSPTGTDFEILSCFLGESHSIPASFDIFSFSFVVESRPLLSSPNKRGGKKGKTLLLFFLIFVFFFLRLKQPEAKASKLVSAIKPTKDIRTTAKAMLLSIFCRSAHVVFG